MSVANPGGWECLGLEIIYPFFLFCIIYKFEMAYKHFATFVEKTNKQKQAVQSQGKWDLHTSAVFCVLSPWLLFTGGHSPRGTDPCWPGSPRAVLQSITSCLNSRFPVAGQLELEPVQEDKQEQSCLGRSPVGVNEKGEAMNSRKVLCH